MLIPRGDEPIRFQYDNPKKYGSKAWTRYNMYKVAKTLREALVLGAASGDITHDFNKGFVRRHVECAVRPERRLRGKQSLSATSNPSERASCASSSSASVSADMAVANVAYGQLAVTESCLVCFSDVRCAHITPHGKQLCGPHPICIVCAKRMMQITGGENRAVSGQLRCPICKDNLGSLRRALVEGAEVYKWTNEDTMQAHVTRTHYDCLGINPDASEIELRAAYRREALRTHPDKGGAVDQFLLAGKAFDVLSDPIRRTAYDQSLGRSCEVPSSHAAEQSQTSAAVFRAAFLEADPQTWHARLQAMSLSVLEPFCSLWEHAPIEVPKSTSRQGVATSSARVASTMQGLVSGKQGYRIKMTWQNLHIESASTLSLDLAIDWYIDVVRLKVTAAGMLSTGMEFSKAATAFADTPVLLKFSFRLAGNRTRLETPLTFDLLTALAHRRSLLELVEKGASSFALQKAHQEMIKGIREARRARAAREGILQQQASEELARRSTGAMSCKRQSDMSDGGAPCKRRLIVSGKGGA